MEKCYKCKINCLAPMPCLKDLHAKYEEMRTCGRTGGACDKPIDEYKPLPKCGNSGPKFEKC
jgi:hypothetical protein